MPMNRDEVALQRWLLLGLVLSTAVAASTRLLAILRTDGLTIVELLLIVVFALLFFWISISFWMACLGAHVLWNGNLPLPLREPDETNPTDHSSSPRTALVMPIYNEDCTQVFAHLQAMLESLRVAQALEQFDFFVLSDSDSIHCLEERAAWLNLRQHNSDARIFYRTRDENIGHKSGNIADFCTNWGALYEYMVVLDADSLMTGRTLVRLVDLMDENRRAALIQAVPLLIGGKTLFARSQQFASWVYGRVYAAGFARLQGPDGNYWGHNAIIRIKPFMENCGLPLLPGRPPLGGEIMSHDFVEAALLRRAGWELWLLSDIDGSYEASPPTLIDHLKRDRRWCQGNLQHLKVLLAQGLHPMSRIHLALGALSYLSSPLWLLLIILFAVHAVQFEHAAPVTYVGRYPALTWPISHTVAFVSVAIATIIMLYGPKILALAVLLHDQEAVRSHGGRRRVILNVLLESLLSTLVAPIYMVTHTWFVMTILMGSNTRWNTQRRGSNGTRFGRAVAAFAPHTAAAIGAGILAWYWTPGDFWWYLPLLSGLATAILLAWLTSLPSCGALARRCGVFVIPVELSGLPILDRVEAVIAERSEAQRMMAADKGRLRLQSA
jgi:membrane glycosyltransferase